MLADDESTHCDFYVSFRLIYNFLFVFFVVKLRALIHIKEIYKCNEFINKML